MGVPLEWTRLCGNLQAAQIERDCLALGLTGAAHDETLQRYTRLVDLIMDDLVALKGSFVMGQITLFLSKKERV